jgi:hypothetical protein
METKLHILLATIERLDVQNLCYNHEEIETTYDAKTYYMHII